MLLLLNCNNNEKNILLDELRELEDLSLSPNQPKFLVSSSPFKGSKTEKIIKNIKFKKDVLKEELINLEKDLVEEIEISPNDKDYIK